MRLPPYVPDHLWLVVRKGWTLAMGLVAAIKARCPKVHRSVQANAVGLSLRTFGAAERELALPERQLDVPQTLRQRLSTAQLRGMAGKQIRSRVAAAIVETAVEPPDKAYSLGHAARCVKMQHRTISRAAKIERLDRAARRRQEANAPHHGTGTEVSPDPVPLTPEPEEFSLAFHERTRTLRPEPVSAEPETSRDWEVSGLPVYRDTDLVAPWLLRDLVRDLAHRKERLDLYPVKPAREILADLDAVEASHEWHRAGADPHERRFAALLLLKACGVHNISSVQDPYIFQRQRLLAYVVADCGAPLEDLAQVARRLARNSSVKSVGAVLAKVELARWFERHGIDRNAIIIRGNPHPKPMSKPSPTKLPSLPPLHLRAEPPEVKVEDCMFRWAQDYEAGMPLAAICEKHHITPEAAREGIMAALRASRWSKGWKFADRQAAT